MRTLTSKICAVLAIALLAVSCVDEKRDELPKLTEEIAVLTTQISDLEEEIKSAPGGLAGALKQARLEILKSSRALLSQRRLAIQNGARFEYVEREEKVNPIKAEEISREIGKLQGEVDNLSSTPIVPGLAGLASQMSLQTKQIALASFKLELEYLKARFGIAWLPDMPQSTQQMQPRPRKKRRLSK